MTARSPVGDAADAARRLKEKGSPERARVLQRFFRTGKGEYGEGDRFYGVPVPETRKLARQCRSLERKEVEKLLRSPFHEERLLALIILVERYRDGGEGRRGAIYRLYLKSTRWINSWDLVDTSAEHIVGAHLLERDRAPLTRLARSPSLWERRIAVMSTFHFIRNGEFGDTLRIAELFLEDGEDLIHKAAGWMLREVGNRDRGVEEIFLKKHCRTMPRTMLRYAIEKFPEPLRQRYLRGKT
ncbi:DNA alkylation repair protein [Candidatus Moduliflexota bacterium]